MGGKIPSEHFGMIDEIFEILRQNADDILSARKNIYELIASKIDVEIWKKSMAFRPSNASTLGQILSCIHEVKDKALIVDVGAGPSRLNEKLAARYPQATVIATDVIDEKLIGRKPKPENLTNCSFLQQPAGSVLPFDDNSVDYLILSCMMHHVKSREIHKLIQEIRRVLKPDGRIILREDTTSYDLTIEGAPNVDENLTRELLGKDESFINMFLAFKDWFSNIIVNVRNVVDMTYNYYPLERWKSIFKEHGLNFSEGHFYGVPYLRGMAVFVKQQHMHTETFSPIPLHVDNATRKAIIEYLFKKLSYKPEITKLNFNITSENIMSAS